MKITRTATMRRAELTLGTAPLPDGVTYLFLPRMIAVGEFPHCAMNVGCNAALLVIINPGRYQYEPWCTREAGHTGDHVAHIGPGQPVAAWTDAS